jgi:hypothetical protein
MFIKVYGIASNKNIKLIRGINRALEWFLWTPAYKCFKGIKTGLYGIDSIKGKK